MDNKLIQAHERLITEKKHLDLAARAGRIFGELKPLPECSDNNERVVKYVTSGSLSITIDGIHDTEGYAKAQEAFKILKRINGAITAWEKEVKADANRFRAMVGDYVKDLTADIDTAKAHLTGIMSEVDRQRQQAEEKLRREEEERYAKRCSGLLSMGMYFDPAQRKFFITGDKDGPGLDDSLVRLGDADSLKGIVGDVFMPRIKKLAGRKAPEPVREEPEVPASVKEPETVAGTTEPPKDDTGEPDSLRKRLERDGQVLGANIHVLRNMMNDQMRTETIRHGIKHLRPKFEELITAIEYLKKETIWND